MSYRHAWGKIKDMERELGAPLVESRRGGRSGGNTRLTPLAMEIVGLFEDRMDRIDMLLKYGRKPFLTVDGLVFRGDKFLAVRRGREPFKGHFALPGGFVEYGETMEEAAVREVLEETSLRTRVVGIVGVYSRPDRDPRGHTISCAFILRELGGTEMAGDDAAEVAWLGTKEPGHLAFDHQEILLDALRIRKGASDMK